MGVRRHQDLKKPKFFSSPTVTGLVLGAGYGNSGRLSNQIAEGAIYYTKGTTSTNKLLSSFISGAGGGSNVHGMQG